MESGKQTGKWYDLKDLKKTELQCYRGREEGISQEISHSSELRSDVIRYYWCWCKRGCKQQRDERCPKQQRTLSCLPPLLPGRKLPENRPEMFPDRADRASPACRRQGKAGDKELRSGGWDYATNTFPLLGSLKLVYRFIMERASWKILFWRCWPAQQKYWHLAVYEKQK